MSKQFIHYTYLCRPNNCIFQLAMAFHHPDILQLQDEDAEFLYYDWDLRPVWPEGWMECDVQHCDSGHISSLSKYRKHWTFRHTKEIMMHYCGHCRYHSPKRFKVTQHYRQKHPMQDIAITSVKKNNKNFLSPGDVLPRKTNVIRVPNAEARDAADRERHDALPAEPVRFNIEHLERCSFTVNRDRYTVVEGNTLRILDNPKWFPYK